MANQGVKITLHWLEQSRAQRIVWLLEELNLEYDIKTYPRVNKIAPPELKKVHPLGKSPLVTLEIPGQEKPLVLAESGFLTEYLIDHYGPHLAPEKYEAGQEPKVGGETETWMRYRHLMHYAEGSLMPFMVMKLVSMNVRDAPVPFFIKPILKRVAAGIDEFVDPNVAANLEFLNAQLASSPKGGKFLTGDKLTAADILMSFPLVAVKSRFGLDRKKLPNLAEYVDMIEKQPKYLSAIKKIEAIDGKPYSVVQAS